jgi:hypothetical protein
MSSANLSKRTNGWDRAIKEAKKQIDKLQTAITVFERNKANGEPWPRKSATQN